MSYRLRAAFCVISACVLSACGGGGDSNVGAEAEAQSQLNSASLNVINGDGVLTNGVHTFDITADGSTGTATMGGTPVEWVDFTVPGAGSDLIKGMLIVVPGNDDQYAIALFQDDANTGDTMYKNIYSCRGSTAWTPEQTAYLTAGTTLTDLPVCTGQAVFTVNRVTGIRKFLAMTGLILPNVVTNDTRSIALNAEINWPLKPTQGATPEWLTPASPDSEI